MFVRELGMVPKHCYRTRVFVSTVDIMRDLSERLPQMIICDYQDTRGSEEFNVIKSDFQCLALQAMEAGHPSMNLTHKG